MAQLYSNENFPLPTVKALRELGHDVLTSHESGNANQRIPDEEVLTFAKSRQRILLTFNRKHFVQLHKANADHAGIILCTVDTDFQALAERIHAALEKEENEDMTGRIANVVRPPQTR